MSGGWRRAAINTLCGTLFLSLVLSCDVSSRLANLLERFIGDGTTGSMTGVSPLINFHLAVLFNPIESARTADQPSSAAGETIAPSPAADSPACSAEIIATSAREKTSVAAPLRKNRAANRPAAPPSKNRRESRRSANSGRPIVEVDLAAHFAEAISELQESEIDHAGLDAIDIHRRREEWRRVRRLLARELPPAGIKIILRRDNYVHTEK